MTNETKHDQECCDKCGDSEMMSGGINYTCQNPLCPCHQPPKELVIKPTDKPVNRGIVLTHMTEGEFREPPKEEKGEECSQSKRVDGKKHSWVFDGDDPYIVCCWCGERRDAISGARVNSMQKPPPVEKPSQQAAGWEKETDEFVYTILLRIEEKKKTRLKGRAEIIKHIRSLLLKATKETNEAWDEKWVRHTNRHIQLRWDAIKEAVEAERQRISEAVGKIDVEKLDRTINPTVEHFYREAVEATKRIVIELINEPPKGI